jgi:UPF0755 protein
MKFLGLLVLVVGIAGGAAVYWWRLPPTERPGARTLLSIVDRPAPNSDGPVGFEVHEGESAASVGKRLQEVGLIQNAYVFRVWASTLGVDSQLEAGRYELPGGLTAQQALLHLDRAEAPQRRVTLVEGWRMEEMADELERKGIVSRFAFLEAARNVAPDGVSDPSVRTAEGYLFPDTYFFPTSSLSGPEVVERLTSTFHSRFDEELQREATTKGLSLHELVTLASIVERETVVPEELPHIASVLLNRLEAGLKLEADPTVQYALGFRPDHVATFGYWKTDLTTADLAIDSPYNTYIVFGLPPGPIANPGLGALLAVLRPLTTQDYYFVARPDGTHAFAATLEEHIRNIRLNFP